MKKKTPQRCKWTVTFEVSDNWIADQFSLSQECVNEMIHNRLPYARPDEVTATVTSEPGEGDIRRAIYRHDRADDGGKFSGDATSAVSRAE